MPIFPVLKSSTLSCLLIACWNAPYGGRFFFFGYFYLTNTLRKLPDLESCRYLVDAELNQWLTGTFLGNIEWYFCFTELVSITHKMTSFQVITWLNCISRLNKDAVCLSPTTVTTLPLLHVGPICYLWHLFRPIYM